MRRHNLSLAVLTFVLLGLTVAAMADDSALTRSDNATSESNATQSSTVVGDWNFVLSGTQVAGMCPMGQDGSGTLSIVSQDSGLAIQYITGMECDPADVCVLFGSCQGNHCLFSTTVTVDEEDGKVTNSADLTVVSPTSMQGTGSSVYNHPSGFTCSWTYNLSLTR